ncbi:MAG: hypothetical protein KDJ36_16915, partial [Hyphomicrobiaceae bacterium]|nr:hypothetical protein [Hyphomicrobiaceae bacterium]
MPAARQQPTTPPPVKTGGSGSATAGSTSAATVPEGLSSLAVGTPPQSAASPQPTLAQLKPAQQEVPHPANDPTSDVE